MSYKFALKQRVKIYTDAFPDGLNGTVTNLPHKLLVTVKTDRWEYITTVHERQCVALIKKRPPKEILVKLGYGGTLRTYAANLPPVSDGWSSYVRKDDK